MIIIIIIISVAAMAVSMALFLYQRRAGREPDDMDLMEGCEFELYCAELLRKNGFQEVELTRASGDYGVDILAEKDGVTYAVQCKRHTAPVGVEAVLCTYGGLAYYERMVGVIMTNQYFTAPAVEAAKKLRILLWDRGYLDAMIDENKL